jgi:hypothetical protein
MLVTTDPRTFTISSVNPSVLLSSQTSQPFTLQLATNLGSGPWFGISRFGACPLLV